MPTTAKDHEEARTKLCCLCFRKIGDMRQITEEQEAQIKIIRYSEFSRMDSRYPVVICRSCALALNANTKVCVIHHRGINFRGF